MTRFEIYCESSLVGWSELECGDPPMGVAFGRFTPAPAYASIQAQVVAATYGEAASPRLVIRILGGSELQCTGGVHIADYSQEVGADGLEVSVLGVSNPPYESLFPQHVAAYERQFNDDA
jgi:hypothetical protein